MVSTRSGASTEGAGGDRIVVADTAHTSGAPGSPKEGGGRRGRRRSRLSSEGGAEGSGEVELGGTRMTASAAYTLMGAAFAMLALPCIFTPKLMARLMFGRAADPPEDQHSHLLALLACGLISAATVALGLEEAARKHMLRTFTADTLKAALMAFAAGNVLLQLNYPATLSPLAAIAAAVTSAGAFSLPASQLQGRGDFGRVTRDFRRLPRNLHYLFTLRKPSLSGALYLLLTWMFPMAGLLYFVAPKYTLYHAFGYVYGKSTQMLWKAVGLGLMTLLPAMTYTLKDKAENDLLGRSVARTLNIGLMVASIGHLLVFGPILAQRHGGFLLPLLVSTWSTALLASMAGLSTPEAASALAEGAGAAVEKAREALAAAAPAGPGVEGPVEAKEE